MIACCGLATYDRLSHTVEVITNADRSISALLGASPGASVSVNIVLNVVKMCFPQLLETPEGKARMKEMIPTYDENIKLPENAERFREVSRKADAILQRDFLQGATAAAMSRARTGCRAAQVRNTRVTSATGAG